MQKIKINAFTLIELLVVIAIIGILSALIVIGMSSTTQKASVAKAQVFANSLRNSLLADMVSEWKLDDGTGNSTTKDSWASAFANTGTLGTAAVGDASEPTWLSTGCVSGNCLSFDGADDYVDFGNNASLSMGTKDHTVSLWVKFDNATAPAPNNAETLARCGVQAAGVGRDGYWIYRTGSSLFFYFSDGSADSIGGSLSGSGTLIANTWYNIVVALDRDISAYMYINGVKQTGYSLNIVPQNGDVQNTSLLMIGATSAGYGRLDGQMDEVRIFHAITTISQIEQNYFAGLNKLLANRGVETSEYEQRVANLTSNYAKN
ncbi:MAG: LamG-like jellyroll fold domain-containing protein [Candidatus Paceibacterota bacterium]